MSETSAVAALIESLGGYKLVADRIHAADTTVAAWKTRGAIPRGQWPELIDAFPDLTLDDLKATERAA